MFDQYAKEDENFKVSLEKLFSWFEYLNCLPDSKLKFDSLDLCLKTLDDLRQLFNKEQHTRNVENWTGFGICEEAIGKQFNRLGLRETVNVMASYIAPYVYDANLNQLKKIDTQNITTWEHSFLWDPIFEKVIENPVMKNVQTRYVFQSYAAPSLFKPSIGEVLSFAPSREVNGFYHKELINCNFAMQSGFHVHSVVFFKLEE